MPPRHLYIHVPFCRRRCAYCDFAIAVRRVVPVDEFLAGVERELALRFAGAEEAWTLDTLYLGGGTPSLLGGDGIARLIEIVRRRTQLSAGAEVTIEANPDDISATDAAAWREAGVNRLSVGAQSFDPAVLAWMHRTHTADRIREAVETIREVGIQNFSLDLIFSLPDHLRRDWARDLDLALSLDPPHISLYGLTVEGGTPLGRWVERGTVAEAPEESYEREYLMADERATAAGLEHYEVSNFGRPGFRSRHNSVYWSGLPWAGIGPSAHEFDGAVRRWNHSAYAEWARRLAAGEDPVAGSETLSGESRELERMYLGLRTSVGLALREGQAREVQPWIDAGWARLDASGVLRLTPSGWLRLDSLASGLTVVRSRY